MLDNLGIELDEDHQDLQDLDDNERVNLFEEAKKAKLSQGGHTMTQDELKELNGLGAITGVDNLGDLLSDFVAGGGQVIGLGPGETFSMGI